MQCSCLPTANFIKQAQHNNPYRLQTPILMVGNNMPYLTYISDNLARVVSLFLFQPNLGSFDSVILSFPSNAAEIPAVIAQSQTPSFRSSHHTPAKRSTAATDSGNAATRSGIYSHPQKREHHFCWDARRQTSPREPRRKKARRRLPSSPLPKSRNMGSCIKKGTLHTLSQKPNR